MQVLCGRKQALHCARRARLGTWDGVAAARAVANAVRIELQGFFDVRRPIHIDDFYAELHLHACRLGRVAAQHVGNALRQIGFGVWRAPGQQAQLCMYKCAPLWGRAHGINLARDQAGF